MTGPRYLPGRDYHALKAATRQLVDYAGGGNRAAQVSRLGQSEYSRGGSLTPDNAERFLPIDVVADLEAATGQPVVTRLLAEFCDCLLIELPKGDAGVLAAEAGLSAQRFGELMAEYGKAIADGSIDAREAPEVLRHIRQLMVALGRFAETVKARAEAGDG